MFCFLKLETPQQDTFGRPDLPLRVFPAPGLDDGPGDAPITEQGLCGRITLTPAPTQPRGAGVGVSPAHPMGFLPGSMSALITTSVREYPDKSSSWPARVQAGHLPGPSWKQRQQREPMCRERLGSRWPDPKDRLSTVSTSLPPFSWLIPPRGHPPGPLLAYVLTSLLCSPRGRTPKPAQGR